MKPVVSGHLFVFAVFFVSITAVTGAGRAMAGPAGGMPPPPAVTVDVMQTEPVAIWRDFPGRLSAVDYVEIRSQVSGAITEIRFTDGQVVAKDDILFVIDPTPYAAAVAQAKADLQAAKSQRDLSAKEFARAQDLIKAAAISQRTFDERQSAERVAANMVDVASARLKQAQIDFDRAYIKAPVAGRISRAEMTVGNLVQAGPNAPLLTTITSNDGIYADFEVDEQTYLRFVHNVAPDQAAQAKIPVKMILKSAGDMSYDGTMRSFDNHIDAATGTIRARAFFPNTDGALLPGMFVTVRLGSPTADNVILVSEKAVGTDQDRKFVYVVGKDGMIEYRPVTLGATVAGRRVVLGGLADGDRVISDGIIKLRPGMPVTIAPDKTDAPPAPAAVKTPE